MNLTIFHQDVFSVNMLLIGGVLALSLSGIFYILQSRGYIFNHDELSAPSAGAGNESSTANDKSKDGVETPDLPKSNVVDETSPLPTFGKTDDPSLEVTPKGKPVELSNDEDETLSEHSSTSSTSSSSSSKTIYSNYFKNKDPKSESDPIDLVETVSDYKSELDSGSNTMSTDSTQEPTITSIFENYIKSMTELNNEHNSKVIELRNEINNTQTEITQYIMNKYEILVEKHKDLLK